ncbi:MAG: hypothetical protein ABIP90_05310 [Vicinamibacterales bacterium]
MPRPAIRGWVALLPPAIIAVSSACAARLYEPPTGSGVPFAEAATVWRDLTASCRGARRFVAEVRVDGWTGAARQGFSATFHTAMTRDNDLYLEVPGPGRSYLQMAGRAGQAVFLLPRDERVLRASTREIVEALTGLRWDAVDLLNVLSGCVTMAQAEFTGANYGTRASIGLGGDARAWVQQRDGHWQVEAAARDGLLIEYRERAGAFPSKVRVSSTSPNVTPLKLTFSVSQHQVNIDLDAATFALTIPPDFAPMTMDDLRSMFPLGDVKGK